MIDGSVPRRGSKVQKIFLNGCGMLGDSLLEREPHMKQKRRAEQWQRASAPIPLALHK